MFLFSARFSKLSLFDDNNSFFSANTFQPYYKTDGTINNTSQLPDLLNGTAETDESNFERERDAKLLLKGLSGFHHMNSSSTIDSSNNINLNSNTNNTNEDWEAAFKSVMMRNNKQIEEQYHQHHQQEELFRVQELQKQRNNLVNNLNGMPPTQHLQQQHMYSNGIDHKNNIDYMNGMSEFNRLTQAALLQKQQQQQQQQRLHNNMLQENGHIYPGNMSKFFDFHKNQQNQVSWRC